MTSNFFKEIHEAHKNGVAYKNIRLKKKILAYFATNEIATIAELSKEFNISIPKINESITELIEDEIVKDYGKTTSAVGRKPNTYGLVENSAYFIGAQVGLDSLSIAMINIKKEVISKEDNLPYLLENNEQSILQICNYVNEFIAKHNLPKEKILGVGINLLGRINYRTGYSYSYFNFYEDPLSKLFKQHIGIPTYLENDTKALAYAEFNSGTISDERDALFVNVDMGIGLGILIDGKLYYGKSGFSGEFGHISIFDNDIICNCGKKGCLETEASGYALIRRVTQQISDGATSILTKKFKKIEDIKLNDIIAAAKKDDNLCIEAINHIGDKLGRGIASLINIFNPELIIIGGVVAKSEEYLGLPLKNAINKYSLSTVNRDTKIIISSKNENLGAYGACLLLRDRLLSVTD
jgi:predicted NBD/HSP70 family sugar kinase